MSIWCCYSSNSNAVKSLFFPHFLNSNSILTPIFFPYLSNHTNELYEMNDHRVWRLPNSKKWSHFLPLQDRQRNRLPFICSENLQRPNLAISFNIITNISSNLYFDFQRVHIYTGRTGRTHNNCHCPLKFISVYRK